MPQATLLDFFKSQTPGPFATAAFPHQSLLPQTADELEDDTEGTLGRDVEQAPSDSDKRLYTDPIETPSGLTRRQDQGQSNEESTGDPNGPSPLLSVQGLAIVAIEIEHLPALKRITGNLLPVRYPEKFFDGVVSESIPATFSRVALMDGKPVGWIRCRLDPFPEPTVPPSKTKPIYNRIYVQALCLLAPYRGLGIATFLLQSVTAPPLPQHHDIAHVYAHVWESNEDALRWYERRGFQRIMKVDQYYRKLRPNGAWIVKKDLGQI